MESRVRFGPFELDLPAEQLRMNGVPVRLAPKPFHMLALLVENHGRLVTREQMHERIWGGAHVQLGDSLNFCIRELRRVLDDDAKSPRFIQTVPRRGYRFIAQVDVVEEDAPIRVGARQRKPARVLFAVGFAAIAVAIVIAAPAFENDSDPLEGAARLPTTSKAREMYWRAEYLLSRGDERAVDMLQRVISADTSFAEAYVRLAAALLFRAGGDSSTHALGAWAAGRGVDLAPESAGAHRVMADWYLWREWNADRALAHYERALELDPTDATTHHRFALFWIIVGDADRALVHLTGARAADPLSTVMQADLGWAYAALRKYDIAVATCRDVVELEPASESGWGCLLVSYEQLGQRDSAVTAAIGSARAQGAPEALLHELSSLGAQKALRRFAQWRYDRVAAGQPMNGAMLAAELGDAAAVERWLRRAIERRDPQVLAVSTDPRFDPFRSASWFRDLTQVLPTLAG